MNQAYIFINILLTNPHFRLKIINNQHQSVFSLNHFNTGQKCVAFTPFCILLYIEIRRAMFFLFFLLKNTASFDNMDLQ